MTADSSGTGSRRVVGVFRIAVSAVLLMLLFLMLDTGLIADSIRAVNWWAIPLALTLQMALLALASIRWWVLLDHHNCGYRPATLLAPFYIGIFLNNILPSTLGGSLFRMYYIYRDNHDVAVAVSPVFAERMLGLVAMIATASMVVPFLSNEFPHVRILAGILPWILGLAIAALILLGSRWTHRSVQAALARWSDYSIIAGVLRVAGAVHTYLVHPGLVARVFVISIVIQVMAAGVYYLLGLGVGATLAFPDYLVIVPLVFVAATLPVSIGGLGVREAAAVGMFVAAGMSPDRAGALALLYLLVLFISSAPGLYLLLTLQDFRHIHRQSRRQSIA